MRTCSNCGSPIKGTHCPECSPGAEAFNEAFVSEPSDSVPDPPVAGDAEEYTLGDAVLAVLLEHAQAMLEEESGGLQVLLAGLQDLQAEAIAAANEGGDQGDAAVARRTIAEVAAAMRGCNSRLSQVRSALLRMEAGVWGRCIRCGCIIPRIISAPEAEVCIKCLTKGRR